MFRNDSDIEIINEFFSKFVKCKPPFNFTSLQKEKELNGGKIFH